MSEQIPPAIETQPEAPSPSWFIDEGIPGSGDRPAWLTDKFKSVADLAKSYTELEKKFGSAPEDYDMSKSKFIDPDYAPFQDLKQLAKEKRVPQEVMDKMLESFDKYMDEFSLDESEEIKKIGENAKERLTILDNWAQANLTKDSYEALTGNLRTADGIKALEELRGKMMTNATVIPNGNDGGGAITGATVLDLQKELANPANLKKYKEDPVYRRDYQVRLEGASKSSGYVDKLGG
jgi:hypothetical protein